MKLYGWYMDRIPISRILHDILDLESMYSDVLN